MRYPSLPAFAVALIFAVSAAAADRPNILWLTSEDHGPHLGCYGDPVAWTPNIDALAKQGMVFKHAWSNSPCCAPARTTIISGRLAPSLGAEHMRSEVPMPDGTKMFPQLLRETGYYCSNNAKEDYNLTKPGQVWDVSSNQGHWRGRPAGQPFFAVFNATQSHESQIIKRPHHARTDPTSVRVPEYHPDTPVVRTDWAQYYDQLRVVDEAAGERLRELEADGFAEDTIVFYFADHGPGLPRSKRWPADSGLRVPMVVYFPPKWRHLAPKEYAAGAQSDRLVSFVDLAPTLLSIAGIKPPPYMHGHAFAGPFQAAPQPYLHAFRGRMDERTDFVRTVTDGRFVYLRNFMPHRSQAQHVRTQFRTPTTQVWRRLFDEGKLNDHQATFWREPKAPEELYDLQNDPDEVRNLANVPAHRATLEKLRRELQANAARIRDLGFLAEAEMHARAGSRPPADALANDAAYPFARVFAAADIASRMQLDAVAELKECLRDSDSGVRYWGAMGALMRGKPGVDAMKNELTAALSDASASVRIAAAEALGTHGNAADLERALATLRDCADPTRTSAYAGIAAMDALDHLGAKAAPLAGFVRDMPTVDPKALARGNDYVHRLRDQVLEKLDPAAAEEIAKEAAATKAAKQRKRDRAGTSQ